MQEIAKGAGSDAAAVADAVSDSDPGHAIAAPERPRQVAHTPSANEQGGQADSGLSDALPTGTAFAAPVKPSTHSAHATNACAPASAFAFVSAETLPAIVVADARASDASANEQSGGSPLITERSGAFANDFCIAGIGASAGGLEALCAFFDCMPADSGIAFVVVQHLAPEQKNAGADILARHTPMPVRVAVNGMRPRPNEVITTPPHTTIQLVDGALRLQAQGRQGSSDLQIDRFLASLGQDRGDRAIAIILSGGGADGAIGLKRIEASGGIVIVQSPETATYPTMPRSAIATGLASEVLSIPEMPGVLLDYARHPYTGGPHSLPPLAKIAGAVEDILTRLRNQRGYSFAGYKHGTLIRRIQRRMGLRGILRWNEYASLLKRDTRETDALYQDLLIGVTEFLRDADAWAELREKVLMPLATLSATHEPLRIWVAGCSTGEEAYSIAILTREVLREQGSTRGVQVFATDVNAAALQTARRGTYPSGIAALLPAGWAERYFHPSDDGQHLRIVRELRESVVFGAHNVLADQPFCRLDLICCRDLLIYLDSETQQRVLSQFHFALRPGGTLFLGNAESVGQQEDIFLPISRRWRIFQHAESIPQRSGDGVFETWPEPRTSSSRRSIEALAEQLILDHFSPAAVLVNDKFEALYFSGATLEFLNRPRGTPTRDVLTLARDGLRPPLRNALRRAIAECKSVRVSARLKQATGFQPVRITVSPAGSNTGGEALLLVVFEHRAQLAEAQQEHSESALIRQLEEELKSVHEELDLTVERLESANEDLKVANEEVLSINEELQSINEELESGKEEIRAINEEVKVENQQLHASIESLNARRRETELLFINARLATLRLDQNLRIRCFSPAVRDLCKLLAGDYGRPVTDISPDCIGHGVAEDAAAALAGQSPRARELRLSDERWWLRQIYPSRTSDGQIDGVIVTYADINDSKENAEAAAVAQRRMAETLEERVASRTGQLRALAAELSLAEERERRALAQDLHDDLGQVLSIVKIKLSSLDHSERRGKMRTPLKEIESLIDQANRSVRSLMMQLSPPILQTLGLSASLEWLAEEMERVFGVAVRIDDDGADKPLEEPARTSLFRAVRELLINVAKHSGTQVAELNCLRDGANITVSVTDNGNGFNYPESVDDLMQHASFGLLSVRERVEFLGGQMHVDSAPGDGTTVTLTIPVGDGSTHFPEETP
ncbi:PAS domain-containing protein [Rhodocyclus tenuis]|uniref:CheR family methyltransferase n=1 Tax=Rhodocyclus gracilis TaxID=2929842 RepID=UPI00129894FE|nr:PAS domain-containing protein [Rhodocyclus gracilis]